jgi:hypothetical protein
MADDTADTDTDTFIESHEPANNKYGQNGYQGPSSDLPGQHTTSGFLKQVELPKADANFQTRKIDASAYPTHPGMSAQTAPGKIPSAVDHPVKARKVSK